MPRTAPEAGEVLHSCLLKCSREVAHAVGRAWAGQSQGRGCVFHFMEVVVRVGPRICRGWCCPHPALRRDVRYTLHVRKGGSEREDIHPRPTEQVVSPGQSDRIQQGKEEPEWFTVHHTPAGLAGVFPKQTE